jgi:hypothetical protein
MIIVIENVDYLFMVRQHMLRTLKQLLNIYDFFPVDHPKRKASAKEFFLKNGPKSSDLEETKIEIAKFRQWVLKYTTIPKFL